MTGAASATSEASAPLTALEALQREARWATATPQQREVLKRIALQRDRWTAARQAREQALAQRASRTSVPVDAPLAERLMVFARLHPVATAGVAGLALLLGPRKLWRYGALALPWINKLRR
jgi:hypothetical protein